MSLPAIANHMATYGRNGDSMLVHMTPSEVHGLQALAEKHGTTLTINPDTGLPEAFGLKDFVKAAAPIALGAALGPAGFGIASSALTAGAMVGGVTALATGNLQQGLMAGLGAYGGFGLSQGLAGLGAEQLGGLEQVGGPGMAETVQGSVAPEVVGAEGATQLSGPGMSEAAGASQTAGVDGVVTATGTPATPFNAAQTGQTVQTVTQAPAAVQPSYFDKVGAGLDRATSTGGLGALDKQMAANAASSMGGPASTLGGLGYSAAGVLGSGLLDEKKDLSGTKLHPGYIRPYTYDPYGQRYTAQTPVKADEWGSRSFNAADGGIVALAHGGAVQHYDDGGLTPALATELMQRSMTTGVPTSEFQKYGGYDVVSDLYNSNGGNYALSSIAPDKMAQYQQTVADTGVGNNAILAPAQAPAQPQVQTPAQIQAPAAPAGSTTVAPLVPGRPEGGFTGLNQLRNAYTTGGGSLGYQPAAPKTMAEHDAKYNTLTGGSKAAYDYLTGNAEYSPVPYTKTGEIMKPYAESVLGVPADSTRFAQRFNPTTRKYEANPEYKSFLFDQDTGQTTRGMNQTELRNFVTDPSNLANPTGEPTGRFGKLLEDVRNNVAKVPVWMAQNNLSYEQLANSLGISVSDAKKRYPVTGGQTFDATAYLEANPDVKAALKDSKDLAADAWKHYTTYGQKEGRAYQYGAAAALPEDPVTKTDVLNGDWGGGAKEGGLMTLAGGGMSSYNLGSYSDGGRLLKGPGDGVSDSIPATIGRDQPARLADGEFVVPARIVSELGNGSTDAGARKLYQMMDRVQKARGKTTGKGKVATNSRSDKHLPA